MMDLLIILASIGFGFVTAYLLVAKPSRIKRFRRRQNQRRQPAGEPDYVHQLLLYRQQILRAETERDGIAEENRRLQSQLTAALAQLSEISQVHDADQGTEHYQAADAMDQADDLAAAFPDLIAQHTALEQSINIAEGRLQDLKKAIQEDKLYQELLVEEKKLLESQHEELLQRRDTLEEENKELGQLQEQFLEHALLVEQCHILQRKNRQLEEDKEQLNQKIFRLEQDYHQYDNHLQQQREYEKKLRRISIVSPYHRHNGQQPELFHVELDLDFNTVVDAVDFAKYIFADILEIWDSARESAFISNYASPSNVYLNLQSLAWFGREYFDKNGELGISMYQRLRQLNCSYSSESDSVKNDAKLRNLRNFRHGEQCKIMYDHLKIGTRGGDGSLRIYFAINDENQKIEVGHCGRHLTTKSS